MLSKHILLWGLVFLIVLGSFQTISERQELTTGPTVPELSAGTSKFSIDFNQWATHSYQISDKLFQIQIPEDWEKLPPTKNVLGSFAFSPANVGHSYFQGLKIITGDFTANIKDTAGLEKRFEQLVSGLGFTVNLEILSSTQCTINQYPASRKEYLWTVNRDQNKENILLGQLYLINGSENYLAFQYLMPVEQKSSLLPILNQAFNTIELPK